MGGSEQLFTVGLCPAPSSLVGALHDFAVAILGF